MRLLFYIGLIGFILFEFLRVYFIMPLPGSQEIDSLDIAYFLQTNRWILRLIFILMMIAGFRDAFRSGYKLIPITGLIIAGVLTYMFNFPMNADTMFKQPTNLVFKTKKENRLPLSAIIIGVHDGNEAKAYPVRFLAYHHQVIDTINGKPLMVTYCNVCRTGRVYDPVINNEQEHFRLVGMDHFNAMFEDSKTKSWWRQATGEAVAGKLKGTQLKEISSTQMSLASWLALYPDSKIMQSDEASILQYDSLARFEVGKSMGNLTYTDSLSWKRKSWVIGIELNNQSKAYDWNQLKKHRIINDKISDTPILIALANDNKSFVAFKRPDDKLFQIQNDSLYSNNLVYDLKGHNSKSSLPNLTPINAYQEFWHSWKTFHPNTLK